LFFAIFFLHCFSLLDEDKYTREFFFVHRRFAIKKWRREELRHPIAAGIQRFSSPFTAHDGNKQTG